MKILYYIFAGIMGLVVVTLIVAVGMSDSTIMPTSPSPPASTLAPALVPAPTPVPSSPTPAPAPSSVPMPVPAPISPSPPSDAESSSPSLPETSTIPELGIDTQETEPDLILLHYWEGKGFKTTEPFSIDTSPWFIIWQNEPQYIDGQSMGILQIMVYSTSNPDFPLTLAANTQERGLDTSFIYQKGEFYLTINAANTQWNVSVFIENQ